MQARRERAHRARRARRAGRDDSSLCHTAAVPSAGVRSAAAPLGEFVRLRAQSVVLAPENSHRFQLAMPELDGG